MHERENALGALERAVATGEVNRHEGEEFIFVLEGEVEARLGDEVILLKEGDSIYFESEVPHSFVGRGHRRPRALAVLSVGAK